jgi:NADPH-dependent curcumin reductase CurA
MALENIYAGADYEVVVKVYRKNTATGRTEPAAGLTGCTAYFALTRGGAAIHADVTVALTERSGTAGEYFAILDAAAIDAHLPLGTVCWKAVSKPGDRTRWRPCLVAEDVG